METMNIDKENRDAKETKDSKQRKQPRNTWQMEATSGDAHIHIRQLGQAASRVVEVLTSA